MNKSYSLAELYPLIEEQLRSGGSASFTVNGISMLPMLTDGVDTVKIVKPVFPLKKYDIPFYRRANGQFILHRIIKVTKNEYICRGDHQTVNEYHVTNNNIIGVLDEYTHKGKQKRVDSLKHKIYAIIFVNSAYLRYYIRTIYKKIRSYQK